MAELKRITTTYDGSEDRIRLSGEGANGQRLGIWLTRRLLERLVPVLLDWIAKEARDLPGANEASTTKPRADMPRADTLHSFAQQMARNSLPRQAPVQVRAEDVIWLAQAVDVKRAGQGVRLSFRAVSGEAASLNLAAKPLRQWLNILHDAYLKAGWPLDVWPEWVREAGSMTQGPSVVRH